MDRTHISWRIIMLGLPGTPEPELPWWDIWLKKELTKRPYKGQLAIAICFFVTYPIFVTLLTVWLNMFIGNTIPGATSHYDFPLWSIEYMSFGIGTIGYLWIILGVWISINLVEWIIDRIVGIKNWFYFRKWGENAD